MTPRITLLQSLHKTESWFCAAVICRGFVREERGHPPLLEAKDCARAPCLVLRWWYTRQSGKTQRVVVIPYRRRKTETSVKNCRYTLRNSPEQWNSHPLCDGSVKSRTIPGARDTVLLCNISVQST